VERGLGSSAGFNVFVKIECLFFIAQEECFGEVACHHTLGQRASSVESTSDECRVVRR
jgi:hypothetical protein